jgi:hypothetical protein
MQLHAIGPFGLLLSVFAAALPGQGQTGGQTGPTGTAPTQIAADVDHQVVEMRRQMTEGKVFRSHVRVTVRLKNGNRMNGVVKDGMVVERMDGIRFVAAEASEPGAGIRLYYWNGRNNFVFLPFTDIQEYRINARVTADELALLEREDRQREAAEQQKQAATTTGDAPPVSTGDGSQQPPATTPPAPTPATTPPAKGTDPQNGLTGELQAMYGLLQEFPPSGGWNQAKRDEISRRQAVVGAKPSASEQKFVDKFADWQRACAMFGQQQQQQQQPSSGETGEGDANRRGRSRR